MATNKILIEYGTNQLLFADHATDFGAAPATAGNSLIIGTPKDVQMNMDTIAAAAGWGSAKTTTGDIVDTGTAWPGEYLLGACIENTTAPAAGGTWDFYWAGSQSETDGTGNPGGITGLDATQTVTGNALDQLIPLGSLVVRNNVINIATAIGRLKMPYIYGTLVIVNNTSTAMATTVDETHIVLTPIITHIQAAA